MTSHDHNFKNVFLDYPREALEWIVPQAQSEFGRIIDIQFVRQEPGKRKLSDAYLSLDMPILYTFEKRQLLVWLVEFQEDKKRFSIYKLLRYATDLMEQHPDALIMPAVIFTDRKKWRKDVSRELSLSFGTQQILYFKYLLLKLFDLRAKDYYNVNNPVVKILLPKMNYDPQDRGEVIRQAYQGLYELTSPLLFEKYLDFIDVYAEIQEDERDALYKQLVQEENTVMLAQYIKDKGRQEGMQQGMLMGIEDLMDVKFGENGMRLVPIIGKIKDIERLREIRQIIKNSQSVSEVEKALE